MRAYQVNGPSASGTANKTAVTIVGATTVRIRVYELEVGLTTAPNATDQQLEFGAGRFTAAGTAGSAPTPNPIDPADVASTATAGITHSAEPTYAATYLMDNAENQRAFFRWVWNGPGYEWVMPATAANGFGVKNIGITAAAVVLGTVAFFE